MARLDDSGFIVCSFCGFTAEARVTRRGFHATPIGWADVHIVQESGRRQTEHACDLCVAEMYGQPNPDEETEDESA